ncbi:MAG: hypothetical protein AAGB16_04885, partial [Pseudomonadota bacterium]
MTYLPQIITAVFALLLGLLLGASPMGLLGFVLVGVLGGWLARFQKRGAEWVYWLSIGLVLT